MSSQLLPVNQINALPVESITGAVNGSVYTIGGRVVRYFSPDALGINGITLQRTPAAPLPNGYIWYLATPWLNLLGCSLVSVMLTLYANVTTSPTILLQPFVQYRLGPLDAAPIQTLDESGAPRPEISGMQVLFSGNYGQFAKPDVLHSKQRALFTAGGMMQSAVGQQLALGTDQRFVFLPGGVFFNNPGDINTFSCAMWAT